MIDPHADAVTRMPLRTALTAQDVAGNDGLAAKLLDAEATASGIALSAEAGMAAIQAKGRKLTQLAIELCDQFGFVTPTPRDPAKRGDHVAIEHPDAKAVVRELSARNVIFDFREPNIIRAGCSPLTTRFVDVFDGVGAIAQAR